MDDIVIRGMLKWPDVPAVYGWLSLDRRGSWMIKNVSGRFERIANPRSTSSSPGTTRPTPKGAGTSRTDRSGYTSPSTYTPWVYRLDDTGEGLLTHTGAAPRALEALFVDDAGGLLLEADMGIGVLLDRDLPAFVERLADPRGRTSERLLEDVAAARKPGRCCAARASGLRPSLVRKSPGVSASCSVPRRPLVSRTACENGGCNRV